MNKKMLVGALLVMCICLFFLGLIFNKTANNHKGTSISTGIMVDGQYTELSSGKIGGDAEKYGMLNDSGDIFFTLAGVTGVMALVSFFAIKNK